MGGFPFAAEVDIDIAQDADWLDPFQLIVPDASGTIPMPGGCQWPFGKPIDLTGATVRMLIVPSFGDSRVIASLTNPDQIDITDALAGNCTMHVLAATVAGWPAGSWAHITRLETTTGNQEVMRGACRIFPRGF